MGSFSHIEVVSGAFSQVVVRREVDMLLSGVYTFDSSDDVSAAIQYPFSKQACRLHVGAQVMGPVGVSGGRT
jgi:hypothetical protein